MQRPRGPADYRSCPMANENDVLDATAWPPSVNTLTASDQTPRTAKAWAWRVSRHGLEGSPIPRPASRQRYASTPFFERECNNSLTLLSASLKAAALFDGLAECRPGVCNNVAAPSL